MTAVRTAGACALGAVGALAIVACAAPGSGSDSAVVPNLVHLSRSEAESRLREEGLRWRYAGDAVVRSEPIPSAAPPPRTRPGTAVIGTPYVFPDPEVVGQRPAAGESVARSSVVELEVRGGTSRLLEQLAESRRNIARANERVQ